MKIGFIYDDIIIWDRQNDYNNMRPPVIPIGLELIRFMNIY